MKSFLCLALFAISFASGANAQDAVDEESDAPHRLVDDAWALQFGIGSQTLSSFLGSTFSAKHHSSASRALRYGLTARGGYRHHDEDGGFYHLEIRLTTQFLSYPILARDSDGRIQLFYGVGPEVGVSSQGYPADVIGAADETQISLGAAAVIGAEWFVKERISLSAEYASSLFVAKGRDVMDIRLQPFGVRFGASVYF